MATRFPIATVTNDMASFRRAFEPFFTQNVPSAARRSQNVTQSPSSVLPLDAYAQGDDIIVVAAVPGMNPEEIEISIEKNTVTLSGTIASTVESSGGTNGTSTPTWYLQELPHGAFRRSLTLPFDVDAARADATFENGLLTLTLPKQESAKPRQIRVKVIGTATHDLPDSIEESVEPATNEA